jgi:H/ACA ribonucleoprotein complex subunit 4
MELKKIQETKPILELLEFCIINVDKPAGPTSFKVCEKIRNIMGAKKAGHTGTLDSGVTGVLPILLGRACRLSNYFMKKDKEYIGKMQLHSEITEVKLKEEMDKFIGKIMQKPPVKSRVKRVLRERIVNKFKIIKKQGKIVEFHSDVQAGTYIRKLISDLGEKIGGAHMIELRRVRAGLFLEKDSYTIEEIEKAYIEYKGGKEEKLREILIPAEIIQQVVTKVDVKEESVKSLLNGKPLTEDDLIGKIPNSELISVFSKEKFIGIYKKVSENNIIARPEFVLN